MLQLFLFAQCTRKSEVFCVSITCFVFIFNMLCMSGNEPLLPPVLLVETEREKELAQQLRQAKDRERQLQMELDRMKGDASQSQTEQEESDDTEESSADVSGPEMENRTSNIPVVSVK